MTEEEQARIALAAEWWVDRVLGPNHKITRRDGADHESERTELLLNAMLGMLAPVACKEERQQFIDNLAKEIMAQVEQSGCCEIWVDYHAPDWMVEAGRQAGLKISSMSFPAKSCMRITKGQVLIKDGYGSRMVPLL